MGAEIRPVGEEKRVGWMRGRMMDSWREVMMGSNPPMSLNWVGIESGWIISFAICSKVLVFGCLGQRRKGRGCAYVRIHPIRDYDGPYVSIRLVAWL